MKKFGGVDDDPSLNEEHLAEKINDSGDSLQGFLNRFGGYTEGTWFYDHSVEIRFDKVNHKYFRVDPDLGNLIPLDNVSSVGHIIDRSPALIPWAAKVTIEKLLRTIPIERRGDVLVIPEMTLEKFTEIAMAAKSAHKDILDDAGDIGGMAHACIEASIIKALADDPEKKVRALAYVCKDERATSCANAAFSWMTAHNVRWICTEKKCFSKKHDCSGTMDGKALVDSCCDPICCPTPFKDRLSIIDWKSSNHLHIEYLFQTAAYEAFDEEEHGEDITDRWVIRLGKEDGVFDPWHLTEEDFKEDWQGFLACLHLTKLVRSVTERMKVLKDNRKQAKKEAKIAAKALAKAAAKAERAKQRALKKIEREEERKRIREEAKLARAAAKKAKLEGAQPTTTVAVPDTSEAVTEPLPQSVSVDKDVPIRESVSDVKTTCVADAVTEVLALSPESSKVVAEAREAIASGCSVRFEDEVGSVPTFIIPEG